MLEKKSVFDQMNHLAFLNQLAASVSSNGIIKLKLSQSKLL